MNLLVLLLAAAPVLDLPALPEGDCHQAAFRQTRTLPAMANPLVMHGELRLEGADAFEWRVDTPYRYAFRIEQERIVETLPDGTSRRLDVSQAPWLAGMQKVFAALLDGNANTITDWFAVESKESLADGGTRLRLLPKSDALAQNVPALEIEYAGHLRRVRMPGNGEGYIEIHFEALRACPENR